jgi:predicted branched-subunit amino acid permease
MNLETHEKRSGLFWQGIKGVFPLLIGVFPFGMIYGALAIKAGIPLPASQAMSAMVFAGSSQFLIAQMVSGAIPIVIITLAVVVINLRHALYSASIAPYIQYLSNRWKAVLAYLLTDEAFVTTVTHFEKVGVTPLGHWYFL